MTGNHGMMGFSYEESTGGSFAPMTVDLSTFTVSGTESSWAFGTTSVVGPESGYVNTEIWGTNLSGNYNDDEDGYITSNSIDLSSRVGCSSMISW